MSKRQVIITQMYIAEETFDVPDDVTDVKQWAIDQADKVTHENYEWDGTVILDENDEELFSC